MRFVTNKIGTGKSKTFADLVADYQSKKEAKATVKTASTVQPIRTAEAEKKKDQGPSSGQLDVEPLHQTGESTPVVGGKGKGKDKEEKTEAKTEPAKTVKAESSVVDKDNENTKPAEESGQTKADFPKLTNDPKAGEHRDGDGDQKKAEAKTETKEAAGLANFGDKKANPFGKEDKKDEKKDATDAKEEKPCDDKDKDCKKATSSRQFVKLSNLDAKTKTWMKKYWGTLYPAEFVDAMLADK